MEHLGIIPCKNRGSRSRPERAKNVWLAGIREACPGFEGLTWQIGEILRSDVEDAGRKRGSQVWFRRRAYRCDLAHSQPTATREDNQISHSHFIQANGDFYERLPDQSPCD
jgi:hypothetical protein